MNVNEHAHAIREALRAVERSERELHRHVVTLHSLLASCVVECGEALGLDEDIVASAAPKEPPPNES